MLERDDSKESSLKNSCLVNETAAEQEIDGIEDIDDDKRYIINKRFLFENKFKLKLLILN